MKRSYWLYIAGCVACLLVVVSSVAALNTGVIVGKSGMPLPEAKHYQLFHMAYIPSRNCSVTIKPWYGGEPVEVLVAPETWKSAKIGDWYYCGW